MSDREEYRPAVLEGPEYQVARDRLKADPIIRAMADELAGLPWHKDLCHSDRVTLSVTPRFEFMTGALREYHARGGTVACHIGGPAEAIIALLSEEGA